MGRSIGRKSREKWLRIRRMYEEGRGWPFLFIFSLSLSFLPFDTQHVLHLSAYRTVSDMMFPYGREGWFLWRGVCGKTLFKETAKTKNRLYRKHFLRRLWEREREGEIFGYRATWDWLVVYMMAGQLEFSSIWGGQKG